MHVLITPNGGSAGRCTWPVSRCAMHRNPAPTKHADGSRDRASSPKGARQRGAEPQSKVLLAASIDVAATEIGLHLRHGAPLLRNVLPTRLDDMRHRKWGNQLALRKRFFDSLICVDVGSALATPRSQREQGQAFVLIKKYNFHTTGR